jgi:maleate cis-trans isomerase
VTSTETASADTLPRARLGIILSSGNRTLEPYFRTHAPAALSIHVTRMRMGSAGKRARGDLDADALAAAELLADAGVDAIDLQGTGIMMERGPDGEAALVAAIAERVGGLPVFTATQSVALALKALGIGRFTIVNPGNDGALSRERAYFDAVGLAVADGVSLDRGELTLEIPPEEWISVARDLDRDDSDGFFLSGSHTRATEAVAAIEAATGKPVVTSVQAALWAGVSRLAPRLGSAAGPFDPAMGRLFSTLGRS